MVRIDMSEYMEQYSVSRLIGAPPGYVGYDEGGQLTEAVRRKPYAVLLFDEVEKAHPDVLNVLLQVLDDGRITDGQGRTVDFKNTIIILTSNIGSDLILSSMAKDGRITTETEELLHKLLRTKFRPEFINRLDEIVFFNALSDADMHGIVDLLIADLAKRLQANRLNLSVSESAKAAIIKNGADPLFGARPLKRYIQGHIESLLARFIIENSPEEGSTLTVDADEKGSFIIGQKQYRKRGGNRMNFSLVNPSVPEFPNSDFFIPDFSLRRKKKSPACKGGIRGGFFRLSADSRCSSRNTQTRDPQKNTNHLCCFFSPRSQAYLLQL